MCTICGERIGIEGEALGHIPGSTVIENRIEPTYDKEGGYDEVVYCTRDDNLICRWKNDKIGFITRKTAYDEDFVRDVKKLLQEFTSLWSTYVMHDWETIIAEAEAKYDDLDESDVFFIHNGGKLWLWF